MEIFLTNTSASVTVDLFGGAITDFHLHDEQVNPLSFAFSKEQMPDNNKAGAPYRGHFLCLGRWGLPSEGEMRAGVPNHGEIANILWKQEEISGLLLKMETTGTKEGLHVERIIRLDAIEPVIKVTETIININPLGRLYNMVQHPTLAAPFLDESTVINCNGTNGFDQSNYKHASTNNFLWPYMKDENGISIDLRNPKTKYNSVFSFVVDTSFETGWITAYSPAYNLLFGYAWKRSDYPWIHLWQHWEGDMITYRGIEFGTAGIHQPFPEILSTAVHLLGEKTFEYIDAGESVSKNYFSFIYKPGNKFTGVDDIKIEDDRIRITINRNEIISLQTRRDII